MDALPVGEYANTLTPFLGHREKIAIKIILKDYLNLQRNSAVGTAARLGTDATRQDR
jgi:hypothetical protein